MIRKWKYIFLYLLISFSVLAHPHIFFEGDYKLFVKNDSIEKINLLLIMDEMNSLIFTENVKDENSIKKEELSFYKDLVNHIHISYDGQKDYNVDYVKSYVEEGSLYIDLDVKINKKIKTDKKLIFSVYDKEYFYTYDYSKGNLEIINEGDKYISDFSFNENEEKAFYFGMVYPLEFEVEFY